MRTILISGSSRGIGRAIAEKALQDGHRLSLGVRNVRDLKGSSLDPEISGHERILLNKYEATCPSDAKNWVDASLKKFGNFDTLINCAGIFKSTQLIFKDGEEEDIENIWKVNVMGPWYLTKYAWDTLARSGTGRVVVLVSMSGKRSKGKLAAYSMSKFALMGLCQTMKNVGWDDGIRVTAICPGWVNTDMASAVQAKPKEDMTQPEDIASISLDLLKLNNSCVPFELGINCSLEV